MVEAIRDSFMYFTVFLIINIINFTVTFLFFVSYVYNYIQYILYIYMYIIYIMPLAYQEGMLSEMPDVIYVISM